jgi:elongation factor Ts
MSEPNTISASLVKELRDQTGAGMMECKKALIESGGDLAKAQEILRTKGLAGAQKRTGRHAKEGVIDAYIHLEGRIGAMVEVNSETDFVARTDEFRRLAREVAMQVAAKPDTRWISVDDVPEDQIEAERKIYAEKAAAEGKPENVIDRIVDGQLKAYFKETVLLEQPYIREDSKTVRDLVTELASKVGENIVIRRFARFQLGQEA